MYLKSHPPRDKAVPGPGQYNIPGVTGCESAKYSLRPKTPNHELFSTVKINPGPGQYNYVPSLNDTGSYFLAKFKSSGATVINPKRSARFASYNTKTLKGVPGPGEYDPKT